MSDSKLVIHGNIPSELVASVLTQFKEDYPEGRVRARNCVIYGPVDGPYVAIYRTATGTIVMRPC